MKKLLFIIIILNYSCNQSNDKLKVISKTDEKDSLKYFENGIEVAKSKHRKYYNSDKIDHYFLDISKNEVHQLFEKKDNITKNESNLLNIITGFYPDSSQIEGIEKVLLKLNFTKTSLNEKQKIEVDEVFSEKDTIKTAFAGCLPYYRDIFIFKNKNSIVGLSKICFECGVTRFYGANVNTDGFGIVSDMEKLKHVIRKK